MTQKRYLIAGSFRQADELVKTLGIPRKDIDTISTHDPKYLLPLMNIRDAIFIIDTVSADYHKVKPYLPGNQVVCIKL